MNKVHCPVVMVCLLCPPCLDAQSRPYYQSHFPPEEFKARWERLYERIGTNSVVLEQGMPQVNGFIFLRQNNEFYLRYEDMVVVTETGIENFTEFLPSELDDIERLVGQGGIVQKLPPDSESTSRKLEAQQEPKSAARPDIVIVDPPEQGFFSKSLDFHGIPIKAHQVVADEALYAAYDRLSLLFAHLQIKQPTVISNLVAAGAELHIIGRDQVTTDLPLRRTSNPRKPICVSPSGKQY